MSLGTTVLATQARITERQVKILEGRPAQFNDDAAIQLVMQDWGTAEPWMSRTQQMLQLQEIDILYQSPRTATAFEGTAITRANVSRFTVAKHVNSLVPMCMSGIFYDTAPFELRPRAGTKQDTVRAKKALYSALLDDIKFKQECEPGIESQCMNGTGIWKYGHETTVTIKKRYKRKKDPVRVELPFQQEAQKVRTRESDQFDVEEEKVTKWRPFFEHKPIGTVYVDPGWRKANRISEAKYVIEVAYPTFNDLARLREMPGYNIPAEQDLKDYFFSAASDQAVAPGMTERMTDANSSTVHHAEGREQVTTADPTEKPIMMLERWGGGTVRTVLSVAGRGELCIRNEEHEFNGNPYLSANWWNIQNAGYGLGVGRLVGTDQRVEQGTTNAALDILSFAVNQSYLRKRGANVATQQIRNRLGGIIDVDGPVDEAFKILESPTVPGDVWNALSVSKQASESASGADETMTQGALPARGGSSIGRTATGAAGLAAANAGRIQGPVGRFIDNVLIPFLVALDEMVREHMPMSEIKQIVGDELGKEFELDEDDFLNGQLRWEALAGAHLAAKKAMAQSLPLLIQILENPHLVQQLNATGWTVDVKELFEMLLEMSEWKNNRDVIRRMTPEEQQLFQQFNAAYQKAQSDLLKGNQQYQNDAQLLDQKGTQELAREIVTHALEATKDPMLGSGDKAAGHVMREAFYQTSEPNALGREAGR